MVVTTPSKEKIITSLVSLDRTLGSALSGTQRAVGNGDPAKVVLAVLAVSDGAPTETIRQWLRSRGNADVRAIASSPKTFRSLVERSAHYLATYSPEEVRKRTASKVVRALSTGLPPAEAALIALIALDMMESGRDGTLLTKAFAVAMRTPPKTVLRRADALASRGLLTVAPKRVGVPTRVRLRRTEVLDESVTEQTLTLIEDLGAGKDSALTALFYAVRSPALAYSDLGFDAWYVSLCDALGIRTKIIAHDRSSRVRSKMRSLAGTDNLLDALRVLETPEVVQARDDAEAERKITAALRAEGVAENRARKSAGYTFVEDIAPLPRRGARDIKDWVVESRETANALDAGALPHALDALTRTLRKREWSEDKITATIDAIFPDHEAFRYVVTHGRVPTDRTALVTWVREVQKGYRPMDAVALRRATVRAGLTRAIAKREFPDARLTDFYIARGDVPAGSEIDAIKSWVLAPGVLAPAAAIGTLRDDLEITGWSPQFIESALPRLTEKGTGQHV